MKTTTAEKFHLSMLAEIRPPRRQARSSVVRYLPDLSRQVSFVHGTPVDAVPLGHLAWKVMESLALFDFSALHAKASPLGRTGFDPAHLLGPLLLGSLEGVHHMSKLALRLQTDAAYRLVSGGNEIGVEKLRVFRRGNLLFFNECLTKTIELAYQRNYVNLEETALDSVRIEADAAGASICTLERSEKMVKQLSRSDLTDKTPEQIARHGARLAKHEEAVRHCKEMDLTNYSRTDPLAALMKFPHGGSKPGHRLTTVVAGAAYRFCIAFYLSSKPTDHGLLPPMLEALRARLRRIGVPDDVMVKVAVDAGFSNEDDLAVAVSNDLNIDVALSQASHADAGAINSRGMFGKERFIINGNDATCPAGTKMHGPTKDRGLVIQWHGVGCGKCALRKQCTTADKRTLTHNPVMAERRAKMLELMEDSARKLLYSKRAAIVESQYSVIEDTMGFRRVSSRHPATVPAEIVLKLLAYNLTRLWAADRVAPEGSPHRGAADDRPPATAQTNFFYFLDTESWPIELLDAVVDFLLAEQAPETDLAA